jgi:hypothetical protein
VQKIEEPLPLPLPLVLSNPEATLDNEVSIIVSIKENPVEQ